jgi:cellulose synthase/poly-beta-1,6-N-acetylglucosamine synthase-like glycosyltransferase
VDSKAGSIWPRRSERIKYYNDYYGAANDIQCLWPNYFPVGSTESCLLSLTLVYENRKKKTLIKTAPFAGMVNILVPVYHEERTIRITIDSILNPDISRVRFVHGQGIRSLSRSTLPKIP